MNLLKQSLDRLRKPAGCALLSLMIAGLIAGCRQPEPVNKNITLVNESTFAQHVEGVQGLVLCDFWASWCGPCKTVAPILDELATQYDGRVKVCKIDVDQNPKLAQRFKIRSIPCFVLFKNGQTVDMKIGVKPRREYEDWLNQYLGG